MSKEYCVKEEASHEIVIKKSRFICSIKPVFDKKQAVDFIDEIKTIHPNAAHNCSAYITNNIEHASDDGEPSQTAGVPMLSVLQKQNMNNIVVVVTRYFGGIKLGASGLIRAYSQAVSNAIDNCQIYELIPGVSCKMILAHSDFTKVKSILSRYNLNSYKENFTNGIEIYLSVNNDDFKVIEAEIKEFNYLIQITSIDNIKVIKI